MGKQSTIKKFTAVLVLLGIIIGTTACSADRKFKEKSKVSLSNYDDYKVDMTVVPDLAVGAPAKKAPAKKGFKAIKAAKKTL